MFFNLISDRFSESDVPFSEFVSSMLSGDMQGMNLYMNKVALLTFSSFDTGNKPSEEQNPERFYHGFVPGLLVDKAGEYEVKSNRESGYGRYDVVLEPKNRDDVAVIMEFKVQNKSFGEDSPEQAADSALLQIEEKHYEADLPALCRQA